jgi:hypothetical protein
MIVTSQGELQKLKETQQSKILSRIKIHPQLKSEQ